VNFHLKRLDKTVLRKYNCNMITCDGIIDGGPTGGKRYKGTLLTVVIDRILTMSIEKGDLFVYFTVKCACIS
jgi:hypothetical protein